MTFAEYQRSNRLVSISYRHFVIINNTNLAFFPCVQDQICKIELPAAIIFPSTSFFRYLISFSDSV